MNEKLLQDVMAEVERGKKFVYLGERLLAKAKQISAQTENRIAQLHVNACPRSKEDRPDKN
jgi:hypothetical protein